VDLIQNPAPLALNNKLAPIWRLFYFLSGAFFRNYGSARLTQSHPR